MKTSFKLFRVTTVLSLGAMIISAGCSNAPLRQSTLSTEMEDIPSASEVNIPGFVAAVPMKTAEPWYPIDLRRLGRTGSVNVICVIDSSGKVIDAQADESSDYEFRESALEAVKKWTFTPASQDGVPILSRVVVPVSFELND